MLSNINHFLHFLLGPDQYHLQLWHMVFRMIIVYLVGIFILNIVNKRFIGEKTPFDIILRFLIGSSLANAITGNSPYFPTLFMCLCLILLNSLFGYLSVHSQIIDHWLKGKSVILYQHGKFDRQAMRHHHFTQEDILSEIRKISGLENIHDIKQIMLENSGELSIIPYNIKKNVHRDNDVED